MLWISGIILLSAIVTCIFLLWSHKAEKRLTVEIQCERAPGRFVQLGGGRLHVVERGPEDGPIVVMIPGFSTPHFVFDQNAKALTDAGCRVIIFDHFGRGWSDRPVGRYDAEFYNQELLGLLDSLQLIQPVHLVGYSMGGLIAAEFTVQRAERVKTLFLIATAGFELNMFNNAMFGRVLRAPVIGDLLWSFLGRSYLTNGQQGDPADVQTGCDLQGDLSTQIEFKGLLPALLATWRHLPMQDRDEVFRKAAATGVSIAAVFGDIDTTVGIASADRLRFVTGSTRIDIISGGDHRLPYRSHERINPLLLDHILNRRTDAADTGS